MKMSEFTTKSFLGNAGAAENSYILINYEDNTTQRPVTYKASLQEIGKAIANDQKLYKKTQNGAITTNVSQGAYVNTEAENFASVGYVNTKTNDIITSSNIGLFTMGFASTGYVTSAINTAKNDLASVNYVENRFYGIASEGYVNNATAGLASVNYVTEALEEVGGGLNPLESVTCSVFMEASASETTEHTVYPVMGDRNGNLFQIYSDDSTGLRIRSDIATTAKITSAINGLASTGAVTAAVNGLASTGYVTSAISGLASTGYVTSAISDFVSMTTIIHDIHDSDPDKLGGVLENKFATLTDLNDLVSTGYVTTTLNNAVFFSTDVSNNIWLEDHEGNSLLVFRYSSANNTYTLEAPSN